MDAAAASAAAAKKEGVLNQYNGTSHKRKIADVANARKKHLGFSISLVVCRTRRHAFSAGVGCGLKTMLILNNGAVVVIMVVPPYIDQFKLYGATICTENGSTQS